MPNVVSFQVDSAYTKKRKRMPGTNKVNKPEIKQWNPRSMTEGNTFNGITMTNLLLKSQYSVASCSSWLPQRIYFPTQGTGSYQRVGAKIFLKYLRFKGYIRVFWRNMIGARWRIRLLRCDDFTFTAPTDATQAQNAIIEYLNLYNNNDHPIAGSADWDSVDTVWNLCRHNYYKTVKDIYKNNIIRSKVIASGFIPISAPAEDLNLEGTLTGNAAGAINLVGNVSPEEINNSRYNIPLDIKVKCNDFVDENHTKYYYVLETDTGVGISFTTVNAPFGSLTVASRLFELSFFIRGYFTDI